MPQRTTHWLPVLTHWQHGVGSMQPRMEDQLQCLRDFLVSRWISWGSERGKPVTAAGKGMCRFTSAFLTLALGQDWKFSGGYPEVYLAGKGWVDNPNGGGFRLGQTWVAHHWVTNGTMIVDLTASQFGQPDILLVPVTDARFKATLQPYQVKEALRDVRDRANQWHKEWLKFRPRPEP